VNVLVNVNVPVVRHITLAVAHLVRRICYQHAHPRSAISVFPAHQSQRVPLSFGYVHVYVHEHVHERRGPLPSEN
jgi:hypothetical protein